MKIIAALALLLASAAAAQEVAPSPSEIRPLLIGAAAPDSPLRAMDGSSTYGVDLRKASGEPHDWLPVPSIFLVGADGTIKFVYANPDYKVRLKASVLVAAASAALEPSAPPKP